VVGTAVSVVVELAASRTAEASSARAEAATLSTVAGSVLRGEHPLTALLEQLRETFALTGVTLLERLADDELAPVRHPEARVHGGDRRKPLAGGHAEGGRVPAGWRIAATVGGRPASSPADGDAVVPIGDELMLVLAG